MMKRLLLTAMTALLAVSMAYADQAKGKVVLQVDKTTATNGKQMFVNYCAPCHGADARGHGPVAPALKTPPTDLTLLTRNNHGKYPDSHIAVVLQNGPEIPAHGTAQMPTWGPILGKMNVSNSQDRMLRVSNLSRYLETLQVK